MWKFDYHKDENKAKCFELYSSNVFAIVTSQAFILFLDLLVDDLEVDILFNIIDCYGVVDVIVANSLLRLQSKLGDKNDYDDKIISLYYKAIESGSDIQGVKHDLGILLLRENKQDEAITYLEEEFKQYKTENSLMAIINHRFETANYTKDYIFDSARNVFKSFAQLYVAEVHYNCRGFDDALCFYERCLILDPNNGRALFQMFDITNSLKYHTVPLYVDDCTAVDIKSENSETKTLLFHSSKAVEVIDKDSFCDFSLSDTRYSHFYLKKKGDNVQYLGKEYEIINIDNLYSFYAKKAIQMIISNPTTTVFSGKTPQDAILQMKSFFEKF